MKTDYESLLVSVNGPVVEVSLNRPEVRNALTFKMLDDFDNILAEALRDDDVKVVTLRGEGKVFSAGFDLREAADNLRKTGHITGPDPFAPPSIRRSWYFTKPLIAGVHGFIGVEAQFLLSTCDFIIAAEGTRFSFEATRANSHAFGGVPLAMQLPMRVWKKLVMMGGWLDAEQAHALHLVQRVVPLEDVEGETRRWAEELSKLPSKNVQGAKKGVHRQYELMGLANMEAVQDRVVGSATTAEGSAWFNSVLNDGVDAALKSRDTSFDDDVARI